LQLWERETERGETRRKGKEQARAEPRVAAYTNTKDGLSLSVTGPHLQHRRAEMGWFWALVLRANALAGYVVCYNMCMAMCLVVGVCNYVCFSFLFVFSVSGFKMVMKVLMNPRENNVFYGEETCLNFL
jgi:hypothetical protein